MTGEIVFENATARIGAHRNVLVVKWCDAPKGIAELREFERYGKKLTAEYEKKAVFANVIVGGTPSFSQEARDEVTRLTRSPMFLLGTAQIILVQGLAGVAVRAFLSTSFLLARNKTPNKVFGDLDFGIDWLLGRLREGPVAWTRPELATFVKHVVEV